MPEQAPPPNDSESRDATGPPPAADTAHEDQARVFPCEGCGADLTFHIGVQHLKCPYCGFEKAITLDPDAAVEEQDFRAMLARLAELRSQGQTSEVGMSEVHCDACGATVCFQGTLTSGECPYCGTPLQREHVHDATQRAPVDGLLPFAVNRDRARANLGAWVKSRWFAPNDFKKRGVQGRFDGVYLPYWTFDTMTTNHYVGERGEHYYVTVGSGKNRRRVRHTRWYPASGRFQRFFDDVLTIAATGIPRKRVADLEPWPLARCVPFNQGMLAGFLARTYDIELDAGFVDARHRIDAAIKQDVRSRIGGDTQRIHSINSRYEAITYKHLLLPVWMLAYRYGDKPYQVVINAQTGEVQGDRPYSWVKITMGVLAAMLVVATAAYLYLNT
jgi:predicted RNA-binding Zn-ribbon protein involved in translation (DUF1610 family)